MKNGTQQQLNDIALKVGYAFQLLQSKVDIFRNQEIVITSLYRDGDSGSHGKNEAVDIILQDNSLLPLLAILLHKIFKDTANIFLKYSSEKQHIHIDRDFSKGHKGIIALENPDGKTIQSITWNNIDSVLQLYIKTPGVLYNSTRRCYINELFRVPARISIFIFIIIVIPIIFRVWKVRSVRSHII